MNGHSRRATLATLAVLLLAGVSGCATAPESETAASNAPASITATQPATTPTPAAPTTTSTPLDAAVTQAASGSGSALAALDTLLVHEWATSPTYARDEFGTAWADVDHNGCDTRNDILARDLVGITMKDSCLVATGTLVSAYTGATTGFVRGTGTSTKVQIDHVVALKDAWETGAYALTAGQREALANDPLNLQAVEGNVNAAKSASDASEWLPSSVGYRCMYVARQVSVKKTYGLWVTPAEKAAIAAVLASCPDQPLLVSTLTATLPPVDASTAVFGSTVPNTNTGSNTSTGSTGTDSSVSYANCAAARAAGAAPIRAGQPGYSPRLDRDGDGVACE